MPVQSSSGALMAAVVAAVTAGPTDAGANIYMSRTWPLKVEDLATSAILVENYIEQRRALGPNTPIYHTTTSIKVRGRATSVAGADDAGSLANQVKLEALKFQIESCIADAHANGAFAVEQMSMETEFAQSSDAKQPLGEVVTTLTFEFTEALGNVTSVALQTITTTVDATNRFDPTGTYASPPFPASVVPAPRDHGPDGRAEGGQTFTLPQ